LTFHLNIFLSGPNNSTGTVPKQLGPSPISSSPTNVRRMKRHTIKDIAARLKVSTSTVSRAFNDAYDIKKETRELILKTAKEMNYHPNPIARKLAQKRSFNIGVVVPEFINEYYAEVILGIQDFLFTTGYQVLIMQSNNDPAIELESVKTLMQNRMDGIIICPSMKGENMNYYAEKINKGYAIIFLNRIEQAFPAQKVIFNNWKSCFFATEHLIYEGYKKIYHLAGKDNLGITKDRTKGFIDAMKKHHFTDRDYKVIETGILPERAMAIVQLLIDQNDLPEAFICVSDLIALSTICILKQNGLSVPGDIGVTGFTETRTANLVSPKLTSVKQPTFEMGKIAAEMLINTIHGEDNLSDTIILDGTLNIRESSLKQEYGVR